MIDGKTGIAYREGTFDSWILNESKSYFPLGILEGDSVLDLGGHIGCFAARTKLENRAVPVYSIEAEYSNFEVLKTNAELFDFKAAYGAIVDDKQANQTITVYVNSLKNNALHSTVPVRGRSIQYTTGIGFKATLDFFKPSVIKCDIEGAEYELPWYHLDSMPLVRLVVMELHLTHKGHRQRAHELCGDMFDMGFNIVKKPNIGIKNWTTVAVWKR